MLFTAYPDAQRAIRLFPSSQLQRVVLQHSEACAAAGLDVEGLDGEDDARVQAWLLASAGLLPAALADDLERIDELANERGTACLRGAAQRAGTDIRGLGFTPLEVAVRVFLDQRVLFDSAHGRRIVESLRGTAEFTGQHAGPARPPEPAGLRLLEAQLGQQFDMRLRSPHCRICVGEDEDRLVFTIARGAPLRADEALEGLGTRTEPTSPVYLTERTVQYRPQRRDVVVYEANAGRLRIRGGDAPALQAYRRGFGKLLFGQADWFGTDPIVSLQPLARMGRAVEAPTPGLRAVRLGRLSIRHANGAMALDSEDIWPYLADRMVGGLDEGDLVEATFRVQPLTGSGEFHVTLRTPNHVDAASRDAEVVRPFLEQRGFLARAGARADR